MIFSWFLITQSIPQLQSIYDNFNSDLPRSTKTLISIYNLSQNITLRDVVQVLFFLFILTKVINTKKFNQCIGSSLY